MPVFLLTFVEGLLGPSLSKYAKPLIYALLVVALIGGLGVAKCSYDKRVKDDYVTKTEERAKPATDKAATERAQDTIVNNKTETEMHNAIAAQPDQPIAPTSHALACERLRHAGRHLASCS